MDYSYTSINLSSVSTSISPIKYPFLICKSTTVNGHFQWRTVSLPDGNPQLFPFYPVVLGATRTPEAINMSPRCQSQHQSLARGRRWRKNARCRRGKTSENMGRNEKKPYSSTIEAQFIHVHSTSSCSLQPSVCFKRLIGGRRWFKATESNAINCPERSVYGSFMGASIGWTGEPTCALHFFATGVGTKMGIQPETAQIALNRHQLIVLVGMSSAVCKYSNSWWLHSPWYPWIQCMPGTPARSTDGSEPSHMRYRGQSQQHGAETHALSERRWIPRF